MIKIPIFSSNLTHTLYSNIESNLQHYLGDGFDNYFRKNSLLPEIRDINNTIIKAEDFENLESGSGGLNDAKNAYLVFNALDGMTPYLASLERVWVGITHTIGFNFVKARWLKEVKLKEISAKDKDKIMQSVRLHFFCKGSRGFHRNNAFSSLWWWAYLVQRMDQNNFEANLEVLLRETDVRSALVDRSNTSRSSRVFEALIRVVAKEYPQHPEWFRRSRSRQGGGTYLRWMVRINALGGSTLLKSLEVNELERIFRDLLLEVVQNEVSP